MGKKSALSTYVALEALYIDSLTHNTLVYTPVVELA